MGYGYKRAGRPGYGKGYGFGRRRSAGGTPTPTPSALTFSNGEPLQFSDGQYLELAA